MKISVFGTVYQQFIEIFEVDKKDVEEACIKAEELWIEKHGSPENIESEPIGYYND